MPLSEQQKKELISKILDGIVPPCPICGSSLKVEAPQVGKSGAFSHHYSCTKDKLKEGQTCDLEPGEAYVNWRQNIILKLRNKAIQLFLVGVGSLTIGAVAGWLAWAKPSEEAKNEKQPTVVVNKDNVACELEKEVLNKESQELKTKLTKSEQELETINEEKWKLGLFLTGYRGRKFNNEAKGRDFINEAFENNELDDDAKVEAFKALSVLNMESNKHEYWKTLEKLTLNYGPSSWEGKTYYMAVLYYNLSMKENDNRLIPRGYREEALKYYYQLKLSGNSNYNEKSVYALLRLIYRQNDMTDQEFVNRYFKHYSNPKTNWLYSEG